MAGPTGLEPATFGVTGRRSNQLNYDPAERRIIREMPLGRHPTGPPEKPVVGCIAVFTRESGGHVGFHLGETKTSIRLLGGNQSDEVSESPQNRSRLLGYRLSGSIA